jgi:2-polyprenyl-6-hydroxyphenyl methylase/3-demethylubiquinone-9 3-methyltransferase
MTDLDPERVSTYFAATGTVSRWWTPDEGPLAFHYDAEIQVLDERIAVDPRWRVLDLGTGRGRFGGFFAGKGCRVIGMDLNPEMLEAARATARRLDVADRFDLRLGSADDLSAFEPASFDVVLCMELFDHLPDLGRVLGEARRVLVPDGRLLFTYVPGESLYGALGNVYRWFRARAGETLISRTYTLGEIRERLTACDFRLERYWGLGLLCVSAQTRLFQESLAVRAATAMARAEARLWPYYDRPRLARHGSHVVGLARPVRGGPA